MPETADTPKQSLLTRWRERRDDRRQRRQWRRERSKGFVGAYDAHNRAESSNYRGGFFKRD